MGFTIPNGPDAAVVDQAEPDALDFEALGYRATGVQSGCEVTAQISADMSVNVAAGVAVVDGVPVTVTAATVSVQVSDSDPRFDIVVVDADNVKSVVRGVASATNPVFPTVDLTTHAMLAALYVAASTSAITLAAITDKRIFVERSLRRIHASEATVIEESTTPTGKYTVKADGETTWVESTLKRVSASFMELSSSLRIRSTDAVTSLLTLRARSTSPETQKALDVTDSLGATVASISGDGIIQAANLLRGSGTPFQVVEASQGTLYVDIAAPKNRSLWICEGGVAWSPFRGYDPSDDEVPIGVMSPFLGTPGSEPVGWLPVEGQAISTTDPSTAELAALVGTRYGSGAGTVNLPDMRGRIAMGQGGELGLVMGQELGTLSTVLTINNLPAHDHPIVDPGHRHPTPGRRVSAPAAGGLTPATDEVDAPFALVADPSDYDSTSATGISIGDTGDAEEFSALPPVSGVNWIVKAAATYARATGVELGTAITTVDNGVTAYSTVQDIANAVAADPALVSNAELTAELDDQLTFYDLRFATIGHTHPDGTGGPVPQVDSVNGITGVVVLTAADVGAATTAQGDTADTAVQPASTDTLSNKTITSFTNTVAADSIHLNVLNDSGASIAKGQVVYFTGYNLVGEEAPTIALADASTSATMPGIGVTNEVISNGAYGAVITVGRLTGINTSAYTDGDVLYVSEVAGALTNVSPVPNGVRVLQPIATVLSAGIDGKIRVVAGVQAQSASPDATTTLPGIIEIATQSEVNTGTDATRAVTPATGAAAYAPITGSPSYATSDQGATADSALQPTIADAKGDIVVATADNTVTRLAVGAAGTVMTADPVEATGVRWSAPDAIPTGVVEDYIGATAPADWLMCDGSVVSSLGANAALAAIIGVGTAGMFWDGVAAVGAEEIQLPDFSGASVIGPGGTPGSVLGTKGGSADAIAVTHDHSFSGSTGTDSHSHTVSGSTGSDSHSHGFQRRAVTSGLGTTSSNVAASTTASSTTDTDSHSHSLTGTADTDFHSHSVTGTVGSTGSSGTNANYQPYMILNKIIKL